MSYLEEHLEKHFMSAPEELKLQFAMAARASLRLDMQTKPPRPATAKEIQRESQISLEDQRAWRISLTRPEAIKFLKERTNNTGRLPKRCTADNYRKFFKRTPTTVPGHDDWLLLTYAEWLHFVNITLEPPLPKAIARYLNGGHP